MCVYIFIYVYIYITKIIDTYVCIDIYIERESFGGETL
jgi:hypothetical protein